MAVDPARIRRRMQEAEGSNRRSLGAREARVALRALAVVLDGGRTRNQATQGRRWSRQADLNPHTYRGGRILWRPPLRML